MSGWDYMDPQLTEAAKQLMQVVSDSGGMPTVTSTFRTHEQQQHLWNRYQAGQSALPAAPPGHSAHEYGWAFDMIVEPRNWLPQVGRVWTSWGGQYGGHRDPVHFELYGAGKLAWQLGEEEWPLSGGTGYFSTGQTSQASRSKQPVEGGAFYKLADFLSSFVPGLGVVQLVDSLVTLLDGHEDKATWYLHHPAEALRDLL